MKDFLIQCKIYIKFDEKAHQNNNLRRQGIELYKLVTEPDKIEQDKYESIKYQNEEILVQNDLFKEIYVKSKDEFEELLQNEEIKHEYQSDDNVHLYSLHEGEDEDCLIIDIICARLHEYPNQVFDILKSHIFSYNSVIINIHRKDYNLDSDKFDNLVEISDKF